MIRVTYYRDLNRVTVKGHAHSAERGQDLVCAATSILCYTIAGFVCNMKREGRAENPVIELEEGNAEIVCVPSEAHREEITLAFDAMCGGFDLLAKSYPDNISFEMVGE